MGLHAQKCGGLRLGVGQPLPVAVDGRSHLVERVCHPLADESAQRLRIDGEHVRGMSAVLHAQHLLLNANP